MCANREQIGALVLGELRAAPVRSGCAAVDTSSTKTVQYCTVRVLYPVPVFIVSHMQQAT